MKILTSESHRERLENIKESEKSVITCMRRHRIRDYIQGHVFYNLGDYPYPFKIEPTEYDYTLLHECAQRGAGLIQLHEDWNDSMRMMGADKYTTHDPEGLKHFLSLCHSMDLKVIAYASMGYIQVDDPDNKPDFCLPGKGTLDEVYYHYQRNNPNCAEWVNFIMPKMEQIMDMYGFDGLYNDINCGDFSGTEEMFSEVYSMVKARKGIYKLHVGGSSGVPYDEKVYDYLWVGEAVKDMKEAIKSRNLRPYVTPCPDNRYMSDEDIDYVFAQYIPFLQFPILTYGRPLQGLVVEAPYAQYTKDERYWFYKNVGQYYHAHPNGPYVYSEWSSIPDNPKMKDKWFEYLHLYKPMTTENTLCKLNIGENTLLKSKISENVYVSLFSNEKQYLVVSNLGNQPYELALNGRWRDRVKYIISDHFILEPRKILFLVKQEEQE